MIGSGAQRDAHERGIASMARKFDRCADGCGRAAALWHSAVGLGLPRPLSDPQKAWQQPLPRLLDTVVGIIVGVVCKWAASSLFDKILAEKA
jgi:hypothetical protein